MNKRYKEKITAEGKKRLDSKEMNEMFEAT
jgi:hypothetical protein